jgi:tetratricopeptide (TPR) repeat protein
MTAEGYVRRGYTRLNLQDYQGAIADANQAVRLAPNNALGYILRAEIRRFLGDFQAAIVDANQALRLDSNNFFAYSARANAYLLLGSLQAALADANQAIRFAHKNAVCECAGYALRSEVYYFLSNYQLALADANKAIQLNPKNIDGYTLRGAAQIGLRDYRAAQADLDQAFRVQSTNGYAYYFRGLAALRQGNNQAAISDYKQAVQLIPGFKQSKTYEDYSLIARQRLNAPVAAAPPPPQPAPTVTAQPVAPSSPPVASPVAANTPSINVYNIANQTTVRIDGQNPGSGVIIARSGNTYYVLTAKHVVATPDEYNVVTANGRKFLIDYNQVKKLANLDLAVVQFTSSESFPIAQLGNSEKLPQGENIFVSGWPIIDGSSNHQVTDGRITGLRPGDASGYELTYSSPTGSGMSGGPVFNASGRVIGIHGRGAANQEGGKIGINMGIPIHLFLRQAPQAGLNIQQLGLRSQL